MVFHLRFLTDGRGLPQVYDRCIIPGRACARQKIFLFPKISEQMRTGKDSSIYPAKEQENIHSTSPPVQQADIKAKIRIKIPDDVQDLIRTALKFISLAYLISL